MLKQGKRPRLQTIKVKDYGDTWVNRLAVIGHAFEAMESDIERGAALHFFNSKYGSPPTDRTSR